MKVTTEELKTVFMSGSPVIHNDIEYKCVSAIIYRKDNKGGIYVQAELLDKCLHSVTICRPDKISVKEEIHNG